MSENTVKCSECGFLANRLLSDDSLIEATYRARATGEFKETSSNRRDALRERTYRPCPFVCFVGAEQLEREDDSDWFSVIRKERQCESFIEWRESYSPKEHVEMLNRDNFQKLQLQIENARSEMNEKHLEQARWNTIYSIASAVIGAIVGALVSALMSG